MKLTRKVLITISAMGFVASISGWVGLKIGRPVYYSDGDQAVTAFDLAHASMLRWSQPDPEFEVPGPVRGRVIELPDGRLLYGRARGPRSTDLVVFDPEHPSAGAQPVVELNSRGHDLAPILGPSGRVFFASDRTSGAGGFDIYTASFRDGIFFAVHPLPAGINTGLDETDPTIDRMGGQLVFVRRDPDLDRGRNGRLMVVSLGAPTDIKPVFADPKDGKNPDSSRPVAVSIDRDPVFSPDGIGLYFVREAFGKPLRLMRTFWHQDHYVVPMSVEELQRGGPFRGPSFVADGFGMRLVATGDPTVIHRAVAQEIYPFWEGQWWLEWLILSLIAFFGLLLLLLTLGARWKQLDTITKLLLLSMLIHLLLLLWLSSMEIIRTFTPKGPSTGAIEVHLLSQGSSQGDSDSTDGEVQQNKVNVAREVSFDGHEEALVSSRPGSSVAEPARDLEGADVARPTYQPARESETEATVADQAEQLALRTGVAREARQERERVETAADLRDRTDARPRQAAAERFTVVVPGTDKAMDASAARAASSARSAAAPRRRLPDQNRVAAQKVAVADAPGRLPARAGKAAPETELRVTDAATKALARAESAPSAVRGEAREAAVESATPSTNLIANSPRRRGARVAAGRERVRPRALVARAETLRDAVRGDATTGRAGARAEEQEVPATRSDLGRAEQRAERPVASRDTSSDPGPTATIVAPRSDFDMARVRHTSSVSRQLPDQPRSLTQSMVALNDDLAETRTEVVAKAGKARKQELKKLHATEFERLSTSSEQMVLTRGDPVGDMVRRETAPAPASLLARGSRREAADSATSTRSDVTAQPRALSNGPVVLQDTVAGMPVPSSGSAEAEALDASLRPLVARLEQRDLAVVEPPRRDLDGTGTSRFDFGVRAPGSFLDRSGVRVPVPEIQVAAAELTPYSNRFGAKKLAALKKYGGSEETERAVRRGLAYLARIQNEDGTWGNRRESQRKYGQVFIGKTGLCLLAFLGAGHTPTSDTEYSELTRRTIDALLRTQRESAHFGRSSSYSHGITTYALAECYALTKLDKIREPLINAVQWILVNQNTRRDQRNRGGWGYFSSTLRPEDSYSRSSTTAWQVMALESAKLSGIDVPDRSLRMARDYLLNNYDRRYRYFLYNREPSRLRSSWRTLPASTPAAVFCLQLFGLTPEEDPRLAAGIEYTLDRRPRSYRRYSDEDFVMDAAGNVYFWYYGSLACFLAGGRTWDRWNSALKRVLIGGQSRDGSFRPIDTYANYAGDTDRDRSYTTAMCVLSLEVYYRYFTPLLKGK